MLVFDNPSNPFGTNLLSFIWLNSPGRNEPRLRWNRNDYDSKEGRYISLCVCSSSPQVYDPFIKFLSFFLFYIPFNSIKFFYPISYRSFIVSIVYFFDLCFIRFSLFLFLSSFFLASFSLVFVSSTTREGLHFSHTICSFFSQISMLFFLSALYSKLIHREQWAETICLLAVLVRSRCTDFAGICVRVHLKTRIMNANLKREKKKT